MKQILLLLGGASLVIAGLLDIKYKGLLYQKIKGITCTSCNKN
ncbi:hypothetical protein [Lysinibacillus sp. 54212]